MIRFLILAGYCQLSMYLYLSGKLDHYINTQYSYLSFISTGLSFLLACVQLAIWGKQKPDQLVKAGHSIRLLGLTLPILTGFFVPTVSLDANTVAAKGYYFPLAAGVDDRLESADGTEIQYLQPDTSFYFTKNNYEEQMAQLLTSYAHLDQITVTEQNYMEVMELIYRYPDLFLGKSITYTGFVYRDPDMAEQQFLFRFGIIHCIADSGVYGLLTKGPSMAYDDNSWVRVTGRLTRTYNQKLGRYLPTLEVSDSSAITQPKNPYVYRTFH